ncbi:MAG TPA: M15 family metallopeptidase [Kineosporiaceae bacterium]|nr:M15 family metallopeptidase [Kineosporiaceae bacterium]
MASRPAPSPACRSTRNWSRLCVAVVVAAALTSAAVTPSRAAGNSGTRTAAGRGASATLGGGPGSAEGQPSPAEVQAAQDAAAQAHAEADHRADELTTAQDALTEAAGAAGLALERYRSAVLDLNRTARAVQAAQDRLQRSTEALLEKQTELGVWVRQAYGAGGLLARSPTMTTLLSGTGPDDLDLTLKILDRVGSTARRALTEVERSQAEQVAASAQAQAAQQAASDATVAAATARAQADAAVARQKAAVDRLQQQLTNSRAAAEEADRTAARLARARALADAQARAWSNQLTGEVGECSGQDLSGYANGAIPLAALCPVWGAPGEYLRADAAYALGRLSQAYAAEFGTPVCVTDTYRSYPEQVQVYAERPQLAAAPGTSNHGWGTAADLCGGIESFGTATHSWMLLHAPAFGWFHPSWAEPGGSRPEPWHWEYGG